MDSRVGRDHIGHAARHEQQSVVVVLTTHQRNGFPLKASHFAIRQDWFQPVSHFNAGAMIPNGIQDQHAMIGGFAADAPLLEQIDRIALDVGTVQGIDGHNGDLGVRLFIDLTADVADLRGCTLVEDMCEVVDVAGGLEL